MAEPLTSKKYIDGIYIPAGLLVVGTLIVKREWTPYAALIAIALGLLKYFNTCKFPFVQELELLAAIET
jgi:cytochrome-b5 reductase